MVELIHITNHTQWNCKRTRDGKKWRAALNRQMLHR